jgi:hypothetical protein
MARSWKPVFKAEGAWCENGQRFATKDEALASASARFMVWTVPEAYDAHESDDEPNYKRIDGRDVLITRGVR